MEVVGEAQDGRQAVALVTKLRPEVVLMDIACRCSMVGSHPSGAQIRPGHQSFMLSAHNDDAYVQNATESGAVGFLLKQTRPTMFAGHSRSPPRKNFFQPASPGD